MILPSLSFTKLVIQIQESAKVINAYLEERKLPSLVPLLSISGLTSLI